MKKKILSVLLVAAMALSGAACVEGKDIDRNGGGRDSAAVKSGDIMENYRVDGKGKLSGLSDKGMKADTLVVPAGYEIQVRFDFGVVKHITFESDDDIDVTYSFANCKELETIELPANLTKLPSFSSDESLQEITIPKNITEIPYYSFSGCKSLESVTILGDVTSIGRAAFMNCKSLKTIKLPDSITFIDHQAFKGCEVLTEITLPSGLKEIGQLALADIGLETIIVPEDMELDKWDTSAFGQLHPYTVKVKEGSWADVHFDEVFTKMAEKEYY
ncbi:leucine-rich repeat domain-containing protein [Butyrivibrio sp. AE2032]|uniref:leucine-rich repeat domain-containing protein n=1 Tax=Butyrivibrio sp. AE2032 TaxID=1458463 RepID=UPI0005528F8B|nr:leucine-rich repeat domain-containing protein [Butyrivibrio sp. AE2032]